MSRGVNKVIIIGNLGQDPECKFMPSGEAVCNISVATSKQWTDKNSGQKQERTEWHRIIMFGRLAEVAGEYLRKGSKVYVEGELRTRKWQGQDGQDRYTTEIIAGEMQMLDTQSAGQQGAQQGGYQQPPAQQRQQPQQQQQQRPAQQPQQRQPAQQQQAPQQLQQQYQSNGFDSFNDDIPY